MSMITSSITHLISIKIKPRHDSITDQYNRIFMVKLCLIASAIIGVNYFNDKVTCIVANSNGMDGGFVGSACWIQGFYIFKEMKKRLDDSGYYGIPRNMDYDGINSLGQLCTTTDRALDTISGCQQMEKVYYLQYQYMPFLTATLSLLFYLPYIIFTTTNSDLVSLKSKMSSDDVSVDQILEGYFNKNVNKKRKMRYRVVINMAVKCLYLTVNIATLLICDEVLNGNFMNYGKEYSDWARTTGNYRAHDHNLKVRDEAKPGNVLLPPMGLCEIHEASRDIRNTHVNRHKFICEISPHILYQYVMLVLWVALVAGIIVSAIGLLNTFVGHVISLACFVGKNNPARKLYRALTLREIDYLEFIRRKDMGFYVKLLKKLQVERNIYTKNKKGSDYDNEAL